MNELNTQELVLREAICEALVCDVKRLPTWALIALRFFLSKSSVDKGTRIVEIRNDMYKRLRDFDKNGE